uniref:Uncharacterized protein n=1 Tax=Acartia pacifica TaxID=335913 RepID=A0A0U2M9K4_ACAPC|nr:hypothetical protein [Acartia pacifica]ALS04535.1 hypothetical protein [Acartia pacifica]
MIIRYFSILLWLLGPGVNSNYRGSTSYSRSDYSKSSPYGGYSSKYSGNSYNSRPEYGSRYESPDRYEEPGYPGQYERPDYGKNYYKPSYGHKAFQGKKKSEPCCSLATTKLEVTVLDDVRQPLEGACVHFADSDKMQDTKTDDYGVAVYTVGCCKVHIMVNMPGYQSATREIYLDGDEICETYEKKVVFELEAKCTYKAWIYGVDDLREKSAPGLVSYQYGCDRGNIHHVGGGQVVVAETEEGSGYYDCDDDYTYAAVCLGGCQPGDDVTVKVTAPGSDFISVQEVSGDIVDDDNAVALNVPPLSTHDEELGYNQLLVQFNLYYMFNYVPCLVYSWEIFTVEDGDTLPDERDTVNVADGTFGVIDNLSPDKQLLVMAKIASKDCDCDGDDDIYNENLKGSITISDDACESKTFEVDIYSFFFDYYAQYSDCLLLACICGGSDIHRVVAPTEFSASQQDLENNPNPFNTYCASECY